MSSFWIKGVGLATGLTSLLMMKDRYDSNVEEWHTEAEHHKEHAFIENMYRAKKAYSGNNFFTKMYLWMSDNTWFIQLKDEIHVKKRFIEHVLLDNAIPIGLGITGFSLAFPEAAKATLGGIGKLGKGVGQILGALGGNLLKMIAKIPNLKLGGRLAGAISKLTPGGTGILLAGMGMAAYFAYRLRGEFNGHNQEETFHDFMKGPIFDGSKYPGLGEGGGH